MNMIHVKGSPWSGYYKEGSILLQAVHHVEDAYKIHGYGCHLQCYINYSMYSTRRVNYSPVDSNDMQGLWEQCRPLYWDIQYMWYSHHTSLVHISYYFNGKHSLKILLCLEISVTYLLWHPQAFFWITSYNVQLMCSAHVRRSDF